MSNISEPLDPHKLVEELKDVYKQLNELKSTIDPLTREELKSAYAENYDRSFTSKFPKVDRFYADPSNGQTYGLHSFVPSKGATPDEKGIFGFMKCRGCFITLNEANERAEWLIRNADSYNSIQTCYVGRPFPICADTKKYVQETNEVDIKKDAVRTISQDIKDKKDKEKREIEDIKEREQRLLDEQKEDYVEDPIESYTTLRVKKANLLWTYNTTLSKLKDMQKIIRKTHREIKEMDSRDTAYSRQFFEKYMTARRQAGLPEEDENSDNFIRYMAEDGELDFDINAEE
jgi:hypothetical protein